MTRLLLILILLCGCFSALAAPFVTTNLLLNPGGEANSLTNWISGGVSNPRLDNGSFDTGINPHSGTNDFLAGTGANGSLSQIVSLVGNDGITAQSIDTANLLASVSFWEQGLNQGTPSDDAFVSIVFLDAATNGIGTNASPEIDSHNGTWSNFSASFPVPTGTRFIQYNMNFVRHDGNDLDAFVDDNVLSIVRPPQLPLLNIGKISGGIFVYWPALNSGGFQLEQSTNQSVSNWVKVTNLVSFANGTNQMAISPPIGNKFFRLHHP